MSKLYFHYGVMNCGKTSSLLKANNNYKELSLKTVILSPQIDTRSGLNAVSSRIGISHESIGVSCIDNIISAFIEKGIHEDILNNKLKCIFIDECQFFTIKQINDLAFISEVHNIPIMFYGLMTDFRGNMFESSKRIIELGAKLEEEKTICKCGKKATHNVRYINGIPTLDGDTVAIDGQDKVEYKTYCLKCRNRILNIDLSEEE